MQNLLVSIATGGGDTDGMYRPLRQRLIQDEVIAPLLPSYVKACRDAGQFGDLVAALALAVEAGDFGALLVGDCWSAWSASAWLRHERSPRSGQGAVSRRQARCSLGARPRRFTFGGRRSSRGGRGASIR